MNTRIPSLILALILLAGCTAQTPSPVPTQAPPTVVPATPTSAPTAIPATATVVPTPAPTPAPTALPSFVTHATADLVNVRANPGSMFNVLTMLHSKETTFRVLGQAPGGEWVKIVLEDETEGWIAASYVYAEVDLGGLPVLEPEDAVHVQGAVKDKTRNGIDGIVFSVMQGRENGTVSTKAMTNKAGEFHAFLPAESYGKWYVAFNDIACTSSLMDAACTCIGGSCGTLSPEIAYIVLPQAIPLEFELVK
ncbi:MAG TPA: SH3 domain-containing protein [Bellilinea sp.]|mgnify:CR=1 FL=1|nr:SH3 domain-containing protein [Bellilinea sp.]